MTAKNLIKLLSKYLQSNDTAQAVPEITSESSKEIPQEDEPDNNSNEKDPLHYALAGLANIIPNSIRTPTDSKPVLIMEHATQSESLLNHKDLEYEELCKIKQGFLAQVTSIEIEKYVPILKARPVFAVLNQKTLSLFENENVNSLLKTIDIKRVKPGQRPIDWNGIFCWQLVRGDMESVKMDVSEMEAKSVDKDALVSLCTESKSEMQAWMKAIQTFHNCVVEEESTEEEEPKDNEDEDALRRSQEQKEAEKNEEEEAEKQEDEADHEEESSLDDEMKEISKEIKDEKAKESQERRKSEERRKKIERRTQQLEEEQKCLEKTLSLRAFEEERQAELLIKKEKMEVDKKLMDGFKDMLKKKEDEEKRRLLQREEELNKNQENMQESIKNMMVQEVVGFEKVLSPSMCYSRKALGGNPEYIKSSCAKMVQPGPGLDIKFLTECLDKNHFCNSCCNYNIGTSKEVEREECYEKCVKIMNANALEAGEFSKDVPIRQLVFTGEEGKDNIIKGDDKLQEEETKRILNNKKSVKFLN